MNKKILGIFLFTAFMVSSVWAQGRKGLRINEVLVTNENNYQDDYGCQSAWIEIFNTTFGTVDVRSCYLTNDRNNPKNILFPRAMFSPRCRLGNMCFSGPTASLTGEHST